MRGLALLLPALIGASPPNVPADSGIGRGLPDHTSVTPDGGSASANAYSSGVVTFTVTNSGADWESYTFTCGVSGAVSSCTPTPMYSGDLAPYSSIIVNVTFTTGAGGAGVVTLTALSDYIIIGGPNAGLADQDSGDYHVDVQGGSSHTVVVTPKGSNDSLVVGSSKDVYFTLHNLGNGTYTFTLSCSSSNTAVLTCAQPSPNQRTVGANSDLTFPVGVTATSTAGSGTVTLHATDGVASDDGTRNFTVYRPNPFSAWITSGPSYERGRCVTTTILGEAAMECGDLLVAHALPAYRSNGRARAVTLLYNSQTVRPTPVAVADYITYAGDAIPSQLRLRAILQSNGQTLDSATYGNTGFSNAYQQTHQMATPIDAVALGFGTGAYGITIQLEVTTGGSTATYTTNTTMVVVDQRDSPIGAGWNVAGVERLYDQGTSGALVAFGDGSALFYAKVGSSYQAPAGEYSTLSFTDHFERTSADHRVTVVYDGNGLVSAVRDRFNNTATYSWVANTPGGWRLSSISDPAGRATTFGYTSGYLTSISQPATSALSLAQTAGNDGRQRPTAITDPDNFVTALAYDAATHRVTSYTGRGLGAVTFEYDASLGRLTRANVPVVPATEFRLPEQTGLATGGTANTAGLSDNAQLVITNPRWTPSTTRDSVWFRVDRFGAPTLVVPQVGNWTVIDRDSLSQPTHVVTPAGLDVWQQWSNGLLQRTIQLSDTSAASRDTTRYEFDTYWRSVTKIVNPERDSVRFGYDGTTGARLWTADGAGNQTSFAYNGLGQMTTVTEPNGTVAQTLSWNGSYNNLGSVTTPATVGATTYSYNANGSDVASVQDPLGAVTSFTYDGIKRPLTVTRVASGQSRGTTYSYDDANRSRTQTGPDGKVTTWQFDALGRVTRRTAPDLAYESYVYGDARNLTWVLNRRGQATNMTYDAGGRMTTKVVSPSATAPGDSISFNYDGAGQLVDVWSTYARITRGYNLRGLMTFEREAVRSFGLDPITGAYAWPAAQHAHRYDRDGRRRVTYVTPPVSYTQPCVVHPDDPTCDGASYPIYGDSILYHFNNRGLLDSITNTMWRHVSTASNGVWTYSYDANGRLATLNTPLGALSYGYDGADRVTSYSGLGRNQSVHYTLDGQVDQMVDGSLTSTFVNDGFGQLTSECCQSGSVSYGYDAAGNRLTGAGWTYAYRTDNGRLNWRSSSGQTINYAYDGDGNTTAETVSGAQGVCGANRRSLDYTTDNHPWHTYRWTVLQGSCQQEERSYWYDGLGRVVLVRSLNQWADDWGVTRLWWLEDEIAVRLQNPLAYPDLFKPMLQRNSSTGTLEAFGEWYYPGPGTDQALASYNFGPGSGDRDGSGNPHRHLLMRDWRGSVITVWEGGGGTTHLSADPQSAFGTGDGSLAAKGPGFNGAPSFEGFQYLRNRWYDPSTGRFTQEDPIGFAGGSNLYAYAGSNPVTFSDPYGLCPPENPARTDDCTVRLNGATIGNPVLLDHLRQFARQVGQHVDLNGSCSGDRTPECNRHVNGAAGSPHLTKEAADIHVNRMSNAQVARAAASSGLFTGVGFYAGSSKHGPHAHVDIHPRERPLTTWSEDSKGKTKPGLPPVPNEDN